MVCHVLQLRSRFAQLASTKQEVQRESMEWYEAVAGQLKAEAEKRLKLERAVRIKRPPLPIVAQFLREEPYVLCSCWLEDSPRCLGHCQEGVSTHWCRPEPPLHCRSGSKPPSGPQRFTPCRRTCASWPES